MQILRLIIFITTFFILSHAGAEELFPLSISSGTPLFAKPSLDEQPIGFFNVETSINARQQFFFRKKRASLYKDIIFFQININGQNAWVCPDIVIKDVGKRKFITFKPNYSYLYGAFFLWGIVLLLLLYYYFRVYKKNYYQIAVKNRLYLLTGIILMAHFGRLLLLLYSANGELRYPLDEMSFFKPAQDLLAWDFSEKWDMTMGMPLVYIPFLLATNANNVFDIVEPFSIFSGMILMPLSLICIFFIVKKLSASEHKAFWAVFIWIMLTMVYCIAESPKQISFFSPLGIQLSHYIRTCYGFIQTGYNSMSGNVSMCTLLIALTCSLYMKSNLRKYIIVGAIFGFSCLTRVNNIFFAPFIAWVFWYTDKIRYEDWKFLLKATVSAIGAFIAVFSIQLIVNHIQFGSIFTFPYVLHPTEVYKGFDIKNIPARINYYFNLHYFYFAIGIAGLATIKDRVLRNSLILWITPLMIFFCGYIVIGQPYRFVLPIFAGLTAAFACSDAWKSDKILYRGMLIVTISLLAFPILPFSFIEQPARNIWYIDFFSSMRRFAAPALWVVTLFTVRKERYLLIFILLYGILIFTASNWLVFAALVALALYGGYEFIRDFIAYNIVNRWRLKSRQPVIEDKG